MGFQKKLQLDKDVESESKKWLITGISMKNSLKPVRVKQREIENGGDDEGPTTPKSKEATIPKKLKCPPAPRKPRSSKFHYNGVVDFFNPPDLESIFICRVESAS